MMVAPYKKCENCGAEYCEKACPYCTIIVVNKDDLPKGVLLLTNISCEQWVDAMEQWRAIGEPGYIPVICGFDPSVQTRIEYVELPQ